MWFIFAVLSSIFAATTSILAKIGLENVNSNLATAIRTLVVVIMAWGIVFITGTQNGITEISKKSWIFLTLSPPRKPARHGFAITKLFKSERHLVVPVDKFSRYNACSCGNRPARRIYG